MMQVPISKRGEIVIPKKIREQLGFHTSATLVIRKGVVELTPQDDDLVKECEVRAKKYHANVKDWVYGNRLYEEEF